MKWGIITTSLALLVTSTTGTLCAAPAPAPAPARLPANLAALTPEVVLPRELATTMRFRDAAATSAPSSARWDSGVLRVAVAGARPNPSEVNVSWRASVPLGRGDVCLVRFYARTVQAQQESGEALFNVQVQPVATGERSLILPVSIGPDWALIEIPFEVVTPAPAEATLLQFSFAFFRQTVEFAGIELWNFGNRAPTSALPLTRFSYPGREAGAPWREAALARIEQIRTAALTVRVTDVAGREIPNAAVEVRLAQPEFLFGSCVDAKLLGADTAEANRYRERVLELFDTVTIDNGLKWPRWSSGAAARKEAIDAVEWIRAHDLRLRGHNLVWPGWKFTPRAVVSRPDRDSVLPNLIDEHIRDIMAATAGRTAAWDVVNEPVHERDYFAAMPESQIAQWFTLARQGDPRTQLFINEYGMLNSRSSPEMIDKYLALIARLRAAGAPIDGIGVQGHVGRQVRAPVDVLSDLDLLASAKLPLHVTEFDLSTPDELLQADYTRDFLIACYSHPAVAGFIMWGFWQPRHWKPDAALFRADWSEKPNAAVWREWVLQRWRTHADGATNARGEFATRGHLGRYDISVTHAGQTTRRSLQLGRGGATEVIKLP